MPTLNPQEIARALDIALAEDIGQGDVTSRATIPESAQFRLAMVARQAMVVAGLPVAEAAFRRLCPTARIDMVESDGAQVAAGTALMWLEGPARGLLTAERTALNFVQHLSGIATLTRAYAERILHTKARLLDTRKTVPGLRVLAKYATRVGGAANHRMRLDDGVLIKDNHIAVCGSAAEAVRRAKAAATGLPIQVECDTLAQVDEALAAGADRLLLDNMDTATLTLAVARVAGRVPLEASGGVSLDTIAAIAETGVDFISVGRITQSAPAVDIGLDRVD